MCDNLVEYGMLWCSLAPHPYKHMLWCSLEAPRLGVFMEKSGRYLPSLIWSYVFSLQKRTTQILSDLRLHDRLTRRCKTVSEKHFLTLSISEHSPDLVFLLDDIALTHCRLNELFPHYILEDSNFDFRYVWLCDSDISREKWLNYLQTVKTLIRCHVLWRLIWIYTVCQLPF